MKWTGWDELRSALWCGLALVALVPWAYLGSGRPIPPSLLSSLTATLWTVLLLLGAAESLASLSALRDRHPHRQGSQAPQAPRLEGGGPRG